MCENCQSASARSLQRCWESLKLETALGVASSLSMAHQNPTWGVKYALFWYFMWQRALVQITFSAFFFIFKSFLNICKIVIFLNQSPTIFSVILPYIFIQCRTSSVWSFIRARVSEIFLWVSKKILGSARPNNCWGKNSQNVRIWKVHFEVLDGPMNLIQLYFYLTNK